MLQDIRLLEQARALFANNVYIRTPYYQFAEKYGCSLFSLYNSNKRNNSSELGVDAKFQFVHNSSSAFSSQANAMTIEQNFT